MRILSLTPGTGGTFYCQNCLRDGQMVRALRRAGHEVLMVPLYLPISLDAEGLGEEQRVFFGGINVYLQQQLGLFRKTPRWLDRIFDSAWMLRQAATREGSTNAADLGPMTWSMLQGRHGKQQKEFERLLEWLRTQPKPDVAHISNALLLGVASALREAFGVPIVCSLQDEDTWIDAMPPPWRDRCWDSIAERARDVDAFVAVSDWYAARMSDRARIPRAQISTVPLGIEWGEVAALERAPEPPVLGYLSRIHATQGFSLLVDAFIELKRDPRLKTLKLRATGGVTSGDRDYVRDVMAKLAAAGLEGDVEIVEAFDRRARQEFLRSLHVLSAPAPVGEAFGLFILEANACGVPVVQPDTGGFREVIELTGGGLVYDPAQPGALVESLRSLLVDPERARALGEAGHVAVRENFTSDAMAARIAEVFERARAGRAAP
jgi:glycosyltransferase involved in cell wall biosynthesis